MTLSNPACLPMYSKQPAARCNFATIVVASDGSFGLVLALLAVVGCCSWQLRQMCNVALHQDINPFNLWPCLRIEGMGARLLCVYVCLLAKLDTAMTLL